MGNYLESAAEEVVQALVVARARAQPVWLATVITTWGSSPRAPGSMMMWSPSSGLVGSVSGGCVEEDLIEKFKAQYFRTDKPEIIIYGKGRAGAVSFQLPCGGQLELLIEAVYCQKDPDLWEDLANTLKNRKGCLRKIQAVTGEWTFATSPPQALQNTPSEIRVYLGPDFKLLIVGANQIAAYLARFAQALNFSVSVCDPGEDRAANFPQKGLRFLQAYPDGIVEREFCDNASAVVTVSHDPRLDDMALLEALPGKAFYVGAMGSLRTSELRRKRLLDLGLNTKDVLKLKAPIGLDIGSKSPAEIAISIAADLVRASKVRDRSEQ